MLKQDKYLADSFYSHWQRLQEQNLAEQIQQVTPLQVQQTLARPHMTLNAMMHLLSPVAEQYLETLAQGSRQLTRQRFGNTLGFFIPLYLSNLCANDCSYCGFSMSNRLKRKTLDMDQLERECQAIKKMGYDTILLVTGEHESQVGVGYFIQALAVVKRYFSYVMMEVQPLSTDAYKQLRRAGLDGVLVYQECYQQQTYARHHLRGNKTDFRWRLETPDRLGRAEVDKIGLGCLLGLDNWRLDALMLAAHLEYLQNTYWRSRYSVAFPRLRPCEGGIEVEHNVSDKQLLQLICAFRLFSPQVEIALSTREPAPLRDGLLTLGVTHISAGSKTQPGGYDEQESALEQFEIDDIRSPAVMAQQVNQAGLEVVWKDWQRFS